MRRPRSLGMTRAVSSIAGPGLIGAGLLLESLLMARGAPLGSGAICGHGALAAFHCAGCYAALAAVALGLGVTASAGSSATALASASRRRS